MVSLCPLEESKVKFVVVSDIDWSKVLPGAKLIFSFRSVSLKLDGLPAWDVQSMTGGPRCPNMSH